MPKVRLVQDLPTWTRACREMAQYFYKMHDTSMLEYFSDPSVPMSSFPKGVAFLVGSEGTPEFIATMEAVPLYFYVDVVEDWGKASVGGPLSASQPLQTALLDSTAVLPALATPVQNHTEEAPTPFPLPPVIASQPFIVVYQSPVSRIDDVPDSHSTATLVLPPEPYRRVSSPVVQGPFQWSSSTTEVPSNSHPSSRSILSVPL